jgi:hypothetical protein
LEQLLGDGHQIVVATFDRELVQLIETRHRHRGIDVF